jgi:histidine triad (HIT) family protein
MSEKNVFQKILDGELASSLVFEDEHCIVIKDLYPKAPLHLLIIPRKSIRTFADLDSTEDAALLTHMMFLAQRLADENACAGYRLQFNVGEKGGQVVFHLHLHLMGWF